MHRCTFVPLLPKTPMTTDPLTHLVLLVLVLLTVFVGIVASKDARRTIVLGPVAMGGVVFLVVVVGLLISRRPPYNASDVPTDPPYNASDVPLFNLPRKMPPYNASNDPLFNLNPRPKMMTFAKMFKLMQTLPDGKEKTALANHIWNSRKILGVAFPKASSTPS